MRGSDWERETKGKPAYCDDVLQRAVLPLAAGMDGEHLSVQAEWIDQGTGQAVAWDSAKKHPRSWLKGENVTNTVRVTVIYRFLGGVLGFGPFYLKSTSEVPMMF